METRALDLSHDLTIIVRPLANGDADTVGSVFARLGDDSRRRRFNAAKPCLTDAELVELARIDGTHHALVAWVFGEVRPAALAHLVRTSRDSAEVAFVVADEHQQRGIGSALTAMLLDDARAAGIKEITALASGDNRAAVALIRSAACCILEIRLEGPEQSIRAAIA